VYDVEDDFLESPEMPLIKPIATSLHYAALCGFCELVEHLLIKYPQHANALGSGRGAALHAASAQNHVEVAQLLLEHGSYVDVRGPHERSPLQLAARKGHLEIVRFLLDHGANVDSRQNNLWTPLHYATLYGYADVSQMLLEHNADVNSRDQWAGFHCINHQRSHSTKVTILALCGYYWSTVRTWTQRIWKT